MNDLDNNFLLTLQGIVSLSILLNSTDTTKLRNDNHCIVYNIIFSFSDYKTGFGGEFGVQTDRVDKNAVGWEHNEKVCIRKKTFESRMEFLTIGF